MNIKRHFALMFSLLGMVCASWAQTVPDSVKIKLETSAGGEIGIDGELSSTNLMSIKVPVGKHKVIVNYGSSFQKEYDIDVKVGGQTTFEFPLDGKLNIKSTPEATILIDGINQGKTPYSFELLGRHSVRIEANKDLYFPQTEIVEISPFQELNKSYVLKKRPPKCYGFLVASYMPKAESLSLMGGIGRRFGVYVKCNYSLNGNPITERNDYSNVHEGEFKAEPRYVGGNIGLTWRPFPWLTGYVGSGYGKYSHGKIKDNDSTPYFVKGVEADLGIMLKWKALLLQVGYTGIIPESNDTGHRFGELSVGIGFTIHKERTR